MAIMIKRNLFTLLFSTLKGVVALGGLLALLGWSSDYFITRSIISDLYRDFYAYTAEKPVDILVVGTSHSRSGINTLQISKQLDATVYNLAMPAQGIGQTYYTLKDALLHTKPRLVLIDSYFADHPEILKDREYFAYEQLQSMASVEVRMEYMKNLVPMENWFDAAFPVINEHENWKEPTTMKKNFFFNLGTSTEKNRHFNGFTPITSVMTEDSLGKIAVMEPKPLEPLSAESKDYIRKIVALCRQNGAEPVFIQIPLLPHYVAKVDYDARSAEMTALLKSLDAAWLDGNHEMTGLAPNHFADEVSDIGNNHLNAQGSQLYTAVLGEALKARYGLVLSQGSGQNLGEPWQLLNFLGSLKKQELVLLTVNDDASGGWLPQETAALQRFNLKQLPVDMPRHAYTAIFTGDGTVLWEKRSAQRIDTAFPKDTLLQGLKIPVNVRITSAGPPASEGHVYLNGQEFSMNSRGLNCVVYDMDQGKVTRVELFDLYDRSLYLSELLSVQSSEQSAEAVGSLKR